MTRFMKKLLGLEARKPAGARTHQRVRLSLESLEERVLQAERGSLDNGVDPGECHMALTGRPAPFTWLSQFKNDEAFNHMERMIRQGRSVVTSTFSFVYNFNLVPGHAYTVVSVIRDARGRPDSVLIRNPWGGTGAAGLLRISWASFKHDMTGLWVG